VPEKYFRNLVPGAPATVTFEALPDLEMTGKLTAIIPRADPQARTFPVKVTIPNREGRVGAGMLARVALPAGESYRATVVPKDAVVTQGPASFVYVLNGDNTVSQTSVEPGDGAGAWIVVRGPVEPGARVITRGNERLQEGQTVMGEVLEYELP
jgi:RND family efflux transporter MFP subunit